MASIPHISWSRLSPFPPPPCDTGVSIKAQLFFVCVLNPPSVHIDKRSSLHIWTIVGSAKLMESCTYLWPALSGCTYSICAVLCFIGFCASPKELFPRGQVFHRLVLPDCMVHSVGLLRCFITHTRVISLLQGEGTTNEEHFSLLPHSSVNIGFFFHYCQNSPKVDIPASLFFFFSDMVPS